MDLILALRELIGELSVEDMNMIADINKIRLNLKFMTELFKENSKC